MTRLLRRLRYLFQRDRHERELDDELRFHLEMKRQELESRGLDRAAAATAARRALGNLPLTRDHVHDVWIAPWLQSVLQDIRYGLRTLRRHPGFATVAIATLALGIGANTAIFSVVNAVLLTPLPCRDSDQLVYIVQNTHGPMTSDRPAPQAPAALDTVQLLSLRSRIQSLSHVTALGITSSTLTGQGDGMPAPAPATRPDEAAPVPPRFALVGVEDRLTARAARVRPALVVLAAAAGLVLLIACANVANLLIAHAAAREREVVTRLFLGAGRGRLLRQSLTESLTLAVLGGGVGIGLAYAGVRLLPALAASSSRRDLDAAVILPRLDEVGIDASVLVFAVAVSVLTGLLSGTIPALRGTRPGSADLLRQGGGSTVSGFDVRGGNRAQGLLVAFEITNRARRCSWTCGNCPTPRR